MGKRGRSRMAAAAPVAPPPSRFDEHGIRFDVRDGVRRPAPVWGPVPVTEIALVVGGALFIAGFFVGEARRGVLIGGGALILTVFVAELCAREHFSGFKSHTLLLAFLPVVALHSAVYFLITHLWAGPFALLADLLAMAGLAAWLQRAYRRARA